MILKPYPSFSIVAFEFVFTKTKKVYHPLLYFLALSTLLGFPDDL